MASLKVNPKFKQRMKRKFSELSKLSAQVGHFTENGTHEESGLSYGELARILEFGTSNGIKAYHPLLRLRFMKPVDDENGLREAIYKYISTKGARLKPIEEEFGKTYANYLYEMYGDPSVLPSNSLSTINKKKVNTPLVDSEDLRNNISYKTSSDPSIKKVKK